MQTNDKKVFKRQMYSNDSEVGRMKLQSVKENLYEATTKVVLYSIEMYAKKSLPDWVKTDLLRNLDKANNDLKREKAELEQGHIGMMDITNGCSVINDFLRKDCLYKSRKLLDETLNRKNIQLNENDEKKALIEERIKQLESLEIEKPNNTDEAGSVELENAENDEYDEMIDEEISYLDGSDSDDETDTSLTEIEQFKLEISQIYDMDSIDELLDTVNEDRTSLNNAIESLKKLQGKNKGSLADQADNERIALENLRTLRNAVFAHKNEDEQEISLIGSWEPEAGPMYNWASEILAYIKIIENRYRMYSLFDDFYASKEEKDKFDGCKVYVQRQIKELYVNHSNVILEFAGELYDRDDEECNFGKLIEKMANNWDTGIRYLTMVTNDDLPEFNLFFKECLSGTNKYVDNYIYYRNSIRKAYSKSDMKSTDYYYFKLLYNLNPSIKGIYWKGISYSRNRFAKAVLYKLVKTRNIFQFSARLKDNEKYFDGIDLCKWCEEGLLSTYFAVSDNTEGTALAEEMERTVSDFAKHNNNGKLNMTLYKNAIKACVNLYFYMCKDHSFYYTRSNGQTLNWKSIDDARKYMENSKNFKSYSDVCDFINDINKSYFYKYWKRSLS